MRRQAASTFGSGSAALVAEPEIKTVRALDMAARSVAVGAGPYLKDRGAGEL